MHDGGAACEVGAEADPVGVGDAHARRDDVVDHPGELVHAEDGDRAADAQAGADQLETVDRAGAEVGPHDIGEQAEEAVEVHAVRLHQTVRQQVQTQVGVVRVDRRGRQVGDRGADHNLLDLTGLVVTGQQREVRRNVGALERDGSVVLVLAQFGGGVPGVEDRARLGHVGDAYCRCSLCTHGCTGYASRRQASCPVSPIVIMRAFRPVGGADVAAPNLET